LDLQPSALQLLMISVTVLYQSLLQHDSKPNCIVQWLLIHCSSKSASCCRLLWSCRHTCYDW